MSLSLNGVEVNKLSLNGVEVDKGYLNGVEVFSKNLGVFVHNENGDVFKLVEGAIDYSYQSSYTGGFNANFLSFAGSDDEFVLDSWRYTNGKNSARKLSSSTGLVSNELNTFQGTIQSLILNSKDGKVYVLSGGGTSSRVSKLFYSDMSTDIFQSSVGYWQTSGNPTKTALSKDGDYIFYLDARSGYGRVYKIKCSDLTQDADFLNGNSESNISGNIDHICVGDDGYLYLTAGDEYLMRFDTGTLANHDIVPIDGSSRVGIFISGATVSSLTVKDGFAFITYSTGQLRKVNLSDKTLTTVSTTASGNSSFRSVVDGDFIYTAGFMAGSTLVDVRHVDDLSFFTTLNLNDYGNLELASIDIAGSPYDTLNS